MDARSYESTAFETEQCAATAEMRPWREVGWIFRDGATLAIERQGEHTRAQAASVSHLSDD
jgi:hypothetical protein